MKTNILFFCVILIGFTLTAFGYKNWSNSPSPDLTKKQTACNPVTVLDNDLMNVFNTPIVPDLLYKVDSRFIATITKNELDQATSILDILPKEATQSLKSHTEVEVALLDDHRVVTKSMGKNEFLNDKQLKLLQSTDCSSNIYISSVSRKENRATGDFEYYHLTYFITVIPEQEAEFSSGRDALLDYLKENSKENTAIITKDQLKPGRVNFTITKNGTVENVLLGSSSGYSSVDKNLVELISNMPQKWQPAKNSKGEKVDQALVFFFGLEGC